MTKRRTPEERFWEKVNKGNPDECWLWIGGKTSQGYGGFWLDGKMIPSHRVSWEFHNGTILDNLCVLHECDIKACVNPNHLFLGTLGDNNHDRMLKGRNACRKGTKNTQAKLTEANVHEIRMRAANWESQRSIARDFPVGPEAISEIVLRKNWGWLEERDDEKPLAEIEPLIESQRLSLAQRQREVIDLMYKGYSLTEISTRFEVTGVAVRHLVKNAHKAIGDHPIFEKGGDGRYLYVRRIKKWKEQNVNRS